MGVRFEFEAYGDKLVSRELLDMADRSLDARPAFYTIADDFRGYEEARFDSLGDGTWLPDKLTTVAEKVRKGLDPRVLHATLELRRSLTRKRAKGSYVRVFSNFMLFGTTVKQAKWLQGGTRHMPPRKPLGFTEPQKVQTLKRLQRFVMVGEA
jgi:hypothetical protein